jgi:hypothetical protein
MHNISLSRSLYDATKQKELLLREAPADSELYLRYNKMW